MPRLLKSLLLPLALLAFIAPAALSTAAEAAQVHLRGSFILIERPEGFEESPTVPGLIWEEAKSSILTTELPAAAFEALSQSIQTGKGEVSGQEIEFSSTRTATISGHPAVIGEGRQRAGIGTFDKWIIAIGTPEATLLISAQIPSLYNNPLRRERLEEVLASIEIAPKRSNPLDALAFEFAESPRFRLTQVLSAHTVILTDSHLVDDPARRALFVIGTGPKPDCSLWAADGKQVFAELLVQRLRSVQDLEPLRTEPAQFEGGAGFRTETHGQVNGQRALVVQTVRFDGCRFARTIGIGPASLEALYRQEFEALANGFAWKEAAPAAGAQ